MNIEASFLRSAASARDLPRDGLAEVALVGRSNVGKSSLINALTRRRVARTSAAPGKTRLANIYRVARGAAAPFYLVDLPGYGFARGGSDGFARLIDEYFGNRTPGAVLLVDARHPGLERDRAAWAWLRGRAAWTAIVATKIDKLARGERIRALRELESVVDHPVLPVSAVTGEGLDELWTLIDRQLTRLPPERNPPQGRPGPAATGRPPRRPKSSNSRR